MQINTEGWIIGGGAVRCCSPFFDERETPEPPDLVVIHNISLPGGHFLTGCVQSLFEGTLDCAGDPSFDSLRGLKVSSHFFINRNGLIHQFVSTQKRAWHAGVSLFHGRSKCNDFSIGIELEGSDYVAFEPSQYRSLSLLLASLCERYRSLRYITGHSDIAPGRKTDPGPFFDWTHLFEQCDYPKSLQYCSIKNSGNQGHVG